MKHYKIFFSGFAIFALTIACKKNSPAYSSAAALNIVNASVDINNIIANFATTPIPYYQNQNFIGFGSSAEYGLPIGTSPVVVVSSNDTTRTLYSGMLNLKAGSIYSFYLCGHAQQIDTLFAEDTIPTISDSSAGVRFVNLLQGRKQPISVNLQGNLPTNVEFSGLGYKQISPFKNYPDTGGISNYNFEVRDQASGNLLTRFSWNFTLFKNSTLVLCGSVDPLSSTPPTVFAVNNF